MFEPDVVVVGGRVAGAATAMLLAQQGHDVLILDRATFPSDTLSTHAIARTGMVQLRKWGLLDELLATGAPPIRKVAFHANGQTLDLTFKDRQGVDHLLAPRRIVLDQVLLNAAQRAGARVLTGVTVDGVRFDDRGRANGVKARRNDCDFDVDSRFVVGADGLRSMVARSVGAPILEARDDDSSATYAYFKGDWDAMEYYLGDRSFAGIFPTNDGEANIWVCMPHGRALLHRRTAGTIDAAFDAMIADAAPALAARLAHSAKASTVHGVMRMPNQLRQPVGPGWALVGDAGYHRDPITGLGISDAFRDAELLAEALDVALRSPNEEVVALAGYHRTRDAHLREVFEITCEMSLYPSAERFTELQKQLAVVIEAESAWLASRGVTSGDVSVAS